MTSQLLQQPVSLTVLHGHQPQPQQRPSSRRALTRALELAQEAVRIDATGEDPHGAVFAYAKSVALLNEVMERVMRGEDTESTRRRNSTRRTAGAREDEARRLRSIHDTYYDRMQILVMIYGIPQPDLGLQPDLGPSALVNGFPQPPQPRPEVAPAHPPAQLDHEISPAFEGLAAALMQGSEDVETPVVGHPNPNHPPPRSLPPPPPPPTRQQPPAPVVIRPRSDSNARRQQAQAARPAFPPPVAPPPLPSTTSYSRPSSATDHYRQTQPFPRDVRLDAYGRPVDDAVDAYDDWNEERERQEEEEIRRAYPPPPVTAPRRRNTSGSSANHHLYIPQDLQPDNRDSFYGHTQPSNSASYVVEEPPPPPSSRPPTPAKRPRGNTQSSITSGRSEESSVYSERPVTPPPIPAANAPHPPLPIPHLVSNSTAQGTISQRRKGAEGPSSLDVHVNSTLPHSRSHSPAATDASTISQASQRALPQLPANLGVAGRLRAVSQPGRRPSIIGMQHGSSSSDHDHVPSVPPLPQSALPRKTSFTTAPSRNQDSPAFSLPSLITTSGTPPTPGNYFTPATSTGHSFANGGGVALPPIPNSPLPPMPPVDTVRRPYHLMNLLHTSIVTPTGGYITRKLHVPHDVWTQGGAKLTNLVEKGKCIAVVHQGLDDLSKSSNEFLRAPPQINPAFARAVGERWIRALDEWVGVCDGVLANMGKKLGTKEGMTAKKSTGWTKVTRTFEKMTNGKNLDSPTIYVQNLANLFGEAQLFDEHHQLMAGSGGSYHSIPPDVRSQIEARLKRSSDFFANVIIDFVIRDLGQLLDKYAKKGEKWMEE